MTPPKRARLPFFVRDISASNSQPDACIFEQVEQKLVKFRVKILPFDCEMHDFCNSAVQSLRNICIDSLTLLGLKGQAKPVSKCSSHISTQHVDTQ